MNERDAERLETFVSRVCDFLDSKDINVHYKDQFYKATSSIELIDGTLVPIATEGSVVLHNEFRSYIIKTLLKYIRLMLDSTDHRLFGFAERPLMEFITNWVFIAVSSESIPTKDKERIVTLLFAGHYKYIDNSSLQLQIYLDQKGSHLTRKDLHALNTLELTPYFNRIWSILKDDAIKKRSLSDNLAFLNSHTGYQHVLGYQHMTTHANPLSINELVGDHDRNTRHKIVLVFYLRQTIEYFKDTDPTEYRKLKYLFDKFWDNKKIILS